MRASELRIGNYHKTDGLEIPRMDISSVKVSGESFSAITAYGIYLVQDSKMQFEPVPLTEEWLLKFGFYEDGEYYSKNIYDYKYCFKYRDWAKNWAFFHEFSPDPKDDRVKYPVCFDIKYVHQLQNLFFSLTGGELVITQVNSASDGDRNQDLEK